MMQRFKVVVSYDGFDYVGWQIQASHRGKTIQQTIEEAIGRITHFPVAVVGSGRTDAKVHASGQVFHFSLDFTMNELEWKRAINGQLPHDIQILSVQKVTEEFHARFNAVGKRYDYLVHCGDVDVFSSRYAFQCYYKLDIDKMRQAAAILKGTHDFSSFCANTWEETSNQVRDVRRLEIVEEGKFIRFIYEGKGFMRYMIRMLTGALIEVGRGKITVEDVQIMLESKDKEACRYKAKPQGLTLVRVDYNQEE